MKEYIEAGKIVTTHGIKGELKLYPWCDDPEMFNSIKQIYFDSNGTKSEKITGVRIQKTMILLKLESLDTIEDAAKFRDKIIYVRREDIPLEEGEFLIQDLIGLKVLNADTNLEYGILSDVSQTGANDVYHIKFPDGKERLIPVIEQVVIETLLDEGIMRIRPLEGLFDDED